MFHFRSRVEEGRLKVLPAHFCPLYSCPLLCSLRSGSPELTSSPQHPSPRPSTCSFHMHPEVPDTPIWVRWAV